MIPWVQVQMEELIAKEQEESNRDNANVLHLDSVGDFIGIYNCQNSSNCAIYLFIYF